jgi:formylmethanofuran dehydrogenase subunit E
MDEPVESPRPAAAVETIKCGMCQQRTPAYQTRVVSGRPLCLGCLSSWYGEEEDEP